MHIREPESVILKRAEEGRLKEKLKRKLVKVFAQFEYEIRNTGLIDYPIKDGRTKEQYVDGSVQILDKGHRFFERDFKIFCREVKEVLLDE